MGMHIVIFLFFHMVLISHEYAKILFFVYVLYKEILGVSTESVLDFPCIFLICLSYSLFMWQYGLA